MRFKHFFMKSTVAQISSKFFRFSFLLSVLLLGNSLFGQETDPKKLIKNADKYFSIKNYEEAIPLYLSAIENGAAELPPPVKALMAAMSKVMTGTAYYI